MTSYRSCHPKPTPILGYTTRRHLLLDLDNTTLYKAKRLTEKIQRQWQKVGDALILESSQGDNTQRLLYTRVGRVLTMRSLHNYHLVFDNSIGYNLSCKICETLAALNVLNRDYVKIRKFRGDMTLRVSPAILFEKVKPCPYLVAYIENPYTDRHDGFLDQYLNVLRNAYALRPLFYGASGNLTDTPQTGNRDSNQRAVKALV